MDKTATFGQRRSVISSKGKGKMLDDEERSIKINADGGVEMTFVPTRSGDEEEGGGRAGGGRSGKNAIQRRRKGVETFGAGLEKGGEEPEALMREAEKRGRTQRRKVMRSASKNTFRRM